MIFIKSKWYLGLQILKVRLKASALAHVHLCFSSKKKKNKKPDLQHLTFDVTTESLPPPETAEDTEVVM